MQIFIDSYIGNIYYLNFAFLSYGSYQFWACITTDLIVWNDKLHEANLSHDPYHCSSAKSCNLIPFNIQTN